MPAGVISHKVWPFILSLNFSIFFFFIKDDDISTLLGSGDKVIFVNLFD